MPHSDFLGPKLPLFPSLTSDEQNQLNALDTLAREARERMLTLVYVSVRMQMSAGLSHDEIRKDLLASLGVESETLGVYFHETLVADVQKTVEEALAGCPPRYPQWISPEDLSELGLPHGSS
jgi:hypothetical protein